MIRNRGLITTVRNVAVVIVAAVILILAFKVSLFFIHTRLHHSILSPRILTAFIVFSAGGLIFCGVFLLLVLIYLQIQNGRTT